MAGTFGERLRALRLARGWTQPDVATRLAVSVQYVSDLERGRRVPSHHWVFWAAAQLDCEPAELAPEKKPESDPLPR